MRRRVVITGLGAICGAGRDVPSLWRRLVAGVSSVGPITLFNASGFPTRIAAEVVGWRLEELGADAAWGRRQPRQTQFALAAARQAAAAAGWPLAAHAAERRGAYLGCGELFPDLERLASLLTGHRPGPFARKNQANGAARLLHPHLLEADDLEANNFEAGDAANLVAGMLELRGPVGNCTSACVSSGVAIGQAAELIRAGAADLMVAGGAHGMIHPLGMTGFARLGALSTHNERPDKAYRPFDRARDGFVVGEGAAMVVLEERQAARRRGADIWGELSGFGAAHDAHHVTDPHPQGAGAAAAMRLALADARVAPDEIDYVNAHGSGTAANDKMETRALKAVFGPLAYRTPVSSTKAVTGHLTTACGALEVVIALLALRRGVLPPTINLEHPDPECDLDYVPNTAREWPCRRVLTNNLGFGGQNVSLLLSRDE